MFIITSTIFGVPNFVCFWPWATDAHSLLMGLFWPYRFVSHPNRATDAHSLLMGLFWPCRFVSHPNATDVSTDMGELYFAGMSLIKHALVPSIVRARANLNLTPCR